MPSHCAKEVRRARPLLGTLVEIVVVADPAADWAEAINAAFAAVEQVQRRMSFHDPASSLGRLNAHAAHQPVQVDEWTFRVLEAAAEIHRVSGGLFDVTVAPHLQERGFLPGPKTPGPCGSFADVELGADRWVRFHEPGLRIDLGGIAKGFAVDRAVETLRGGGIAAGLVNAGGDLRAFGDVSFPITLRHPGCPGDALATVGLREGAISTSAHYFADRLVKGAQRGPFVHPQGVESGDQLPQSVSVRAAECLHADALTKVVMLAQEAALPVLEHFGADAFFISTKGEALCSKGWHATLDLSP